MNRCPQTHADMCFAVHKSVLRMGSMHDFSQCQSRTGLSYAMEHKPWYTGQPRAQLTTRLQVSLHVVLLVLHVAEELSDQQQRSDAPFRKAHSLNAAES